MGRSDVAPPHFVPFTASRKNGPYREAHIRNTKNKDLIPTPDLGPALSCAQSDVLGMLRISLVGGAFSFVIAIACQLSLVSILQGGEYVRPHGY